MTHPQMLLTALPPYLSLNHCPEPLVAFYIPPAALRIIFTALLSLAQPFPSEQIGNHALCGVITEYQWRRLNLTSMAIVLY